MGVVGAEELSSARADVKKGETLDSALRRRKTVEAATLDMIGQLRAETPAGRLA